MDDVAQLFQSVEELVVKFCTLIVVDLGWKTKPWNEIIVQLFCYSLCRLVLSCICLGITGEVVHDDKNVLIASTAAFQL